MKPFFVINFNFNQSKFEPYNVMPYLVKQYNDAKEKPSTFEEFKKFVHDKSMYRFWARCEYEIILTDWPCKKSEDKWDIFKQIEMNIDIVTNLLIENVK